MEKNPPKIGIFVCECGGNIGDVVDVKAVIEAAKNWEGVAVVKEHEYLCSKPARARADTSAVSHHFLCQFTSAYVLEPRVVLD